MIWQFRLRRPMDFLPDYSDQWLLQAALWRNVCSPICGSTRVSDSPSSRWTWKKWTGPKQLEDKKTKSLMMLPYVPLEVEFDVKDLKGYLFTVQIMFSPKTRTSRSMPSYTLTMRRSSSKSMYQLFPSKPTDDWRNVSFSAVVAKLFELGVPIEQFTTSEPWILKSLEEQQK